MLKANIETTNTKKRMLYVEDEAILGMSQKIKFEKKCYIVTLANSGEEALEFIN